MGLAVFILTPKHSYTTLYSLFLSKQNFYRTPIFAYIAIMAVMIEGENADFVKIDLGKYADYVKFEP